jgi:ATP phosphoribosyltransferase
MSLSAGAAVRDRLRIAIQNRGRLGTPARALLAACGLAWREAPDQLFCIGEDQPFDLLLVRDDDIPGLIAEGVCDIGIVGRNMSPRKPRGAPPRASLRRLPSSVR